MALHTQFISDFMGKKQTKEGLVKAYLDMGLSEPEANARADIELYAKEKYKIEDTNITGEIPDKDILMIS